MGMPLLTAEPVHLSCAGCGVATTVGAGVSYRSIRRAMLLHGSFDCPRGGPVSLAGHDGACSPRSALTPARGVS